MISRLRDDGGINWSKKVKNKHVGSGFDEFLDEEGILEEAEAVAIKRVIAYQIRELMREQNLTKSAMAEKMQTSRAALNRLMDPENVSVTLQTLHKAANALGKRIRIELSNQAAGISTG